MHPLLQFSGGPVPLGLFQGKKEETRGRGIIAEEERDFNGLDNKLLD
jgi:hypothetical protein